MVDFQCVGVDVAKDKFDVAFFVANKCHQKCFANNKKGFRDFIKWLKNHAIQPWVCMEATGHYSEIIADFLMKHHIRVSIVNPLQIKSFARAKLARNKNDNLDAKIIAEYCEAMSPHVFVARSQSQKELKDLTKLLETLKMQLIQLQNQLESTQGKFAKKAIQQLVKELRKEIERIERHLDSLTEADSELTQKMQLITSVPGVGKLTAYKILAQAPNMQNFSTAKQFAAYIGVTPKQHQSGKYIGRTTISRIGDSRLRKALYMAALVAKRYNKALQPFVKRLEKNSKTPKSIVCAVMRKLAHILFGILKSNRPFNPALV